MVEYPRCLRSSKLSVTMWRWVLGLICLTSLASAQVPKGTPIHVMMLKEVSSSGSYPGDLVPLVVTADVEVDGRVLIPEGTMAFGKIGQTRREGALSATVFDKPARLWITLEHLRDVDGNPVKLQARPDKSADLQITREMTAVTTKKQSDEIQMAWGDPKARSVMEKVHKLFTDSAVNLSVKEAEVLVAHNVEIPIVQQAIRDGLFGQVMGIINDLRRGRALEALLSVTPVTRPALIAVRAVRELGRLSGGIGNYIGGRFKGRNIRCPSGVELTVYAG
jgi:hypothetical protein